VKKHWYEYLWIWSIIYFSLGFFNIIFAWLGLISFLLPLIFAIGFGNKNFCNKYCDRGQFFRMFGSQRGFSRKKDMPTWLKSKTFRYGFLIFFLGMFCSVIYGTYLVFAGVKNLSEVVTLFWTIDFAWNWAYTVKVEDWIAQFVFGFYSLMLTSMLIGIISMILFKPRSWCVFCPMGTMTQFICKLKAGEK